MSGGSAPRSPRRRVLVVGTGSAGLRHIRNLVAIGSEVTAFSHRGAAGGSAPALPEGVALVRSLDEAFAARPDAIFVANRTDAHLGVALDAAQHGCHLFIEKPLSNSLDGVAALRAAAGQRALVVETGFMLRLHPNVAWVRRHLASGALGPIRYIRAAVGQHLADWRPGTDHRASYSAQRGCGGVIFDLVHELDLIELLAGPVEQVSAMTAQDPSLEIESEAIAEIAMRCAGGALAQAHLDYVRPVYGRTLEIVGAEGVLTWDYTMGTVSLAGRDGASRVVHRVPAGFDRNDMFVAHARHFLSRLDDSTLPAVSSLEAGVAALRLALAAHASAAAQRTIAVAELREPVAAAAHG
jgi:predicted dehydrogenase